MLSSEPEAAAVHCANLTDVHKLTPNRNFMICDAGGGTVVRAYCCPTEAAAGYTDGRLVPIQRILPYTKLLGCSRSSRLRRCAHAPARIVVLSSWICDSGSS